MTKKEFLEKLEKKLSILTDEEVEDILNEYGGYIDEKMKKKKMSESEAIKSFGDFDELVKEILSAYKINDKKTNNSFDNFFDNIGETVEGFVNNLSGKDSSEIFKIVVEVIVLVCLIGIFRIPLELVVGLGNSIFDILPGPLDSVIKGIWRFVFEISYLIIAIIFVIKFFKARYIKEPIINKNTEAKIKNEIKKESVTKEEVESLEPKKDESIIDLLVKVFIGFIKIILAFYLIPGVAILTGLIIALCFCISLFINGVTSFIGIFISLLALIIFSILMLEIVIKFIFNKKNSGVKVFATIVIVIVMLSVGIAFTVVEFAQSSYIDVVPEGYNLKSYEETIDGTKYEHIYNWHNVNYIPVDNLGNNIKIEIKYYEEFANPKVIKRDNYIEIDYYNLNRYSGEQFYEIILNDLKNKEFHNYHKLFEPEIIIYGSKELISKYETYNYNNRYLESENNRLEYEVEYWKDKYETLYEQQNLITE